MRPPLNTCASLVALTPIIALLCLGVSGDPNINKGAFAVGGTEGLHPGPGGFHDPDCAHRLQDDTKVLSVRLTWSTSSTPVSALENTEVWKYANRIMSSENYPTKLKLVVCNASMHISESALMPKRCWPKLKQNHPHNPMLSKKHTSN